MALFVGALFYVAVTAAVAFLAPWQTLVGKRFATAAAFSHISGTQWAVRLIMVAAVFGLLQCFNGNMVASSRLLYSFGRRGTIPARFAAVHERYQTPAVAIVGVTLATVCGLLLGDALLVPVTEVGSMAAASGWFAACLSFFLVETRPGGRAVAILGALIALLLVAMKVVPWFPGHFSRPEWIALTVWLAVGAALRLLAGRGPHSAESARV
jgi:amino acid transporter